MFEPKLISPMLDNFIMGEPMSEHHGVRCCPAMEKDSDNKYIVKIISIPASKAQLDALLLTGAYADTAAARSYFQELASGVESEAMVLNRLAQKKGFLPYQAWQIVPMDDGTGFDVYLLSPYKHSLQRFFRKETMTHLGAVNLGLDLCAAMAVCRQAGILYVDLKPGNIFIDEEQEYRIGDLGFVPLNALKYTSLPDRYRSAYTAPEIKDAFSTLNPTVDIYAIGLILYQAFNGGMLPPTGQNPEEPLPPPQYADYEMAEIILKACAPKPEDRWQTPMEMGQEIVNYMQRNGANDTPIVPPPAPTPAAAVQTPVDTSATVRIPEAGEKAEKADAADLTFMETLVSDETAPGEDTVSDVEYSTLSDDTSTMLFQADELIALEMPEPVVAPEPIDVRIPVQPKQPIKETPKSNAAKPEPAPKPAAQEQPDAQPERRRAPVQREKKRPSGVKRFFKRLFVTLLILVLFAGLLYGGYYYYNHFYLVSIQSLTLSGTDDALTVAVGTVSDETLITVTCKDAYGNVLTSGLSGGTAQFEGLTPNTQYQISLEISGFHALTGRTSDTYNTPEQIEIVQFDAQTGNEDGMVILSFTVNGREPEQWSILYSAEGEEEKSVSFTGHTVTIRDLALNKVYDFRLTSTSALFIVGTDHVSYTPIPLVYAESLSITSCADGALTAVWTAPENYSGGNWIVHCYNDSDYDNTITTQETQAVFTDLDTTQGYTVEVTAEGMISGIHTSITANAVTVSNVQADTSNPSHIQISWDYAGSAPEGGWLLLYSVDGLDGQEVVPCESNQGQIAPMVPAASYHCVIQQANGATVFNGSFTVDTPEAPSFSGYRLSASNFEFTMCVTPDKEDWTYNDVPASDITTTFQPGQKASFMLRVFKDYDYDWTEYVSMYVIRDENGAFISANTNTRTWAAMWDQARCYLDIPALPETPGNYTVTVYFNGMYAGEEEFTIAAETAE